MGNRFNSIILILKYQQNIQMQRFPYSLFLTIYNLSVPSRPNRHSDNSSLHENWHLNESNCVHSTYRVNTLNPLHPQELRITHFLISSFHNWKYSILYNIILYKFIPHTNIHTLSNTRTHILILSVPLSMACAILLIYECAMKRN